LAVCFLAPSAALATPPAGYAPPEACAGCHVDIARRYAQTGMARTFGDLKPGAPNGAPTPVTVTHAASAETISVRRAGDEWRMERRQTGFDGTPSNIMSAAMDYWFGSGNHAQSYFSRTSRNELIELPLTRYSEKGGNWAMSPGYDSPAHAGFSRKVNYRCMSCHNAYFELPAGADRMETGTKFPSTLPQGIDCQRCHGPGLRHVNAAAAGRPAEEIRSLIVNPASLPLARRDEVCFQCHLETTGNSLPASLPVAGRGVFSYIPGQPIEQHERFFDYAAGTGHDDRFEFAGVPYRMRKSPCFTESAGALTCITCHDPHEPDKTKSIARANTACVNCHRSLPAQHTASAECVSCHMPERTPVDSIHVTITDHFIRRNPERTAPPTRELNSANTAPYRGEVVPYYPQTDPADLYTAMAQVRSRANMDAGIPRLAKALSAQKPSAPEPYAELADAYRHAGQSAAAIPYYRTAISLDAGYWPAHYGLGLALAAAGDLNGSLAPLRQAAALSGGESAIIRSLASTLTAMGRLPEALTALRDAVAAEPQSSELRNDLGTALLRAGDIQGAEKAMREAVRLRPESAPMRVNLGNLLGRQRKLDEAKFEFQSAIRTNPSLAEAHSGLAVVFASQGRNAEARDELRAALKIDGASANTHNNLGTVLRQLGDHTGAIAEYREAIRYNPAFAAARYNLAVELAERHESAEAEQQLREAIRTQPAYDAAHLRLAQILIAARRPDEALPHLRQAAASKDPNLAGRAAALVRQIAP
jgi:tetratricopeptide (TPR) repeat protein